MLVGDPVAFVVAEDPYLARDAAERIAVEYEPLPSVTATEAAPSADAPKLWAECPDNECVAPPNQSRAFPTATGLRKPVNEAMSPGS